MNTRKHLQKTGKKGQCQCTSECKNKALPNSPFCSAHKNKCSRVSPLSGYEPDYNPDFWNNKYSIKETHNCFAYAFNVNDPKQISKCKDKNCDVPFHQPGMASGHEKFKSDKPKTCPNMVARLVGDNSNINMTTFTEKCPVGTSKIALIVDEDEDYHFLRQDSNGMWSHKPGARNVTNLDASGKKIYDPALADYNYKKKGGGYLNYDNFCSYMCVPRITPIRIKTGGGKKTKKMRGGYTAKSMIQIYYTRNNDDSMELQCLVPEWNIVYSGINDTPEIEPSEYKIVCVGISSKLQEVGDCLRNAMEDYLANNVISGYVIIGDDLTLEQIREHGY